MTGKKIRINKIVLNKNFLFFPDEIIIKFEFWSFFLIISAYVKLNVVTFWLRLV